MPKETVYGRDVPASSSDGDDQRAVVDVHWQPDHCFVQIATHVLDSKPLVLKAPSDELDRIKIINGAEFVRADSSVGAPDSEWSILTAGSGFYVDLDRAGINRLIRNLRRARDQSFGKDA